MNRKYKRVQMLLSTHNSSLITHHSIMAFLLFYVTHPDEATARRVSEHLVNERLVACANIFPITSAYWWQGAVQHESEWVSILKTRPDLENRLEAAIQKIHPYEVPCILRFEVRANEAYEKWIAQETVHG
jgi:periplasmic divalent cation tolerance protein